MVRPCAPLRADRTEQQRRVVELDSAARTEQLAARLREVLSADWIGDLPPHSEERLVSCLVDLLLDAGLPERALSTLAGLDAKADQWVTAGWRLEKGGQRDLAVRAFCEAGRRDPDSSWAFESLSKAEPAAALDLLARRPRWYRRLSAGGAAACRARLLMACGRTQAAIGALRDAVNSGDIDDHYWDVFFELAPEVAADELERLARTCPDETLAARRADLLVARGEERLAADYLSKLVIEQGVRGRVLVGLGGLDPLRALSALRERVARVPADIDAWNELGELALEQGQVEGALDAWQRAFELDPEEAAWTEELWQHRPAQLLESFGAALEGSRDAYLWEEYGDYLWRSGRADEAQDAWSTALACDPEETDFATKLARAQAGLWPL